MSWTRRNFLGSSLTASAAALATTPLVGKAWSAVPTHRDAAINADTVPQAARIAIADLLDHGAHLRSGQRVLLFASLDGLYGGDNLVDRDAIRWLQQAIEQRGNPVEMLWLDEPQLANAWQFPQSLRAAMDRCDVAINHMFDLTMEEILAFRNYVEVERRGHLSMVRNFATTAPLLCTAWAQTPQELVSEIRFQASSLIQPQQKFTLSDPNGTHLEGLILPASTHFRAYALRREETNTYLPWPEWICPPIVLRDVSGTFIFDRMLSWWSRYIGIAPYFEHTITLHVRDGRIVQIEGRDEADALRRFLAAMHDRLGDGVYAFDTLHFGVHPQAHVAPQQCPSALYRRLIEHSDTHNLHVHIGSPQATPNYPYWLHVTGDLRQPTFRIGDRLIHDRGHLTALDNPSVRAVAAKYPGRPGLEPEPFHG